jgi:hypothetical protein
MGLIVLWTILGLAGVTLIAGLIMRLQPVALGADSTRLLALSMALAAYFGVLSVTHHVPALAQPVRLRPMAWLVPLAGGAGMLLLIWRVLQNWPAELHGLIRALLKILLVVALALLTRLCFTL